MNKTVLQGLALVVTIAATSACATKGVCKRWLGRGQRESGDTLQLARRDARGDARERGRCGDSSSVKRRQLETQRPLRV